MIIIGPQGSGKGTYASRIGPILSIPHISTGDLFRENINNKTPIGLKIEKYVNEGKLVPDSIVIEVLNDRLKKEDCKKGFILDGFPRNFEQAKALEKITDIEVVLELVVPQEILLRRLSSRVICRQCGKIYNLLNVKPKKESICDDCEGELYRREDETPESIKIRLNTYERETKPLIDYYKKKGLLKKFFNDNFDLKPEDGVKMILNVLGVKK